MPLLRLREMISGAQKPSQERSDPETTLLSWKHTDPDNHSRTSPEMVMISGEPQERSHAKITSTSPQSTLLTRSASPLLRSRPSQRTVWGQAPSRDHVDLSQEHADLKTTYNLSWGHDHLMYRLETTSGEERSGDQLSISRES